MFSESYHWTRQDFDTCPRVDTCQQSNMFSDNFHWTQATPLVNNLFKERFYEGKKKQLIF